jgi:hypothetical protein
VTPCSLCRYEQTFQRKQVSPKLRQLYEKNYVQRRKSVNCDVIDPIGDNSSQTFSSRVIHVPGVPKFYFGYLYVLLERTCGTVATKFGNLYLLSR